MPISARVDWLRVSIPADLPLAEIVPQSPTFQLVPEPLRALPYYTHAARLYGGGRVDWHHSDPKQRRLVTLTGSDLRAQELAGLDGVQLTKHFLHVPDIRYTRLDLAIDQTDAPSDPAEVLDAYRAGSCRTHFQSCDRKDRYRKAQPRDGITLEFGRRESERMLRVYDKAAEQGTEGTWTRLELELKQRQALRAAQALDTQPLGQVAAGLIREAIKTPVPWFEQLLDDCAAGELAAAPAGRKQTDSEKWVREIAGPAFLRALVAGEVWACRMLADALTEEQPNLTLL